MKIAFDLDNTLIRFQHPFPLEKASWHFWQKISRTEPLRKGFAQLYRELRAEGHGIWVYTASLRPRWYIYQIFACYGLRPDGVINFYIHSSKMLKIKMATHKYPPAFGLDLLVDDSEGVLRESQELNYKVLQIQADDLNWTEKIKTYIHSQT